MDIDPPSSLTVALGGAGLDPADAARIEAVLGDVAGLEPAGDDPDIVLLGPERAAIQLAAEERIVIVAVAEPVRTVVADALAAGARGVVVLTDIERTLAPAARAVAAGLVVIPDADAHPSRRPVLSAREKQILGLVTMGLTNAEIGRRLFLAESTVKYHLLSVYDKLGVRTRKEAADLVLDPRSGLGAGILSLAEQDGGGRRGAYAKPTVR